VDTGGREERAGDEPDAPAAGPGWLWAGLLAVAHGLLRRGERAASVRSRKRR
jgi:hypothetical protein